MKGADLDDIRRLLGHAELRMTVRYAHLGQDHLDAAGSRLDGVLTLSASPATEVLKPIGAPDASFHTLRHTAASWMVQQGVDLYAVGQILGHKTPRMTQRYAHLSPDYMAGAVGKLDGIMGGMVLQTALK